MKARPRIGIACDLTRRNDRIYEQCPSTYGRAVSAAGGLPVLLPPTTDRTLLVDYCDALDGLLFPGGDDIPGDRFGEPNHPDLTPVLPERLEGDLALIELALERHLPILAICYGAQVLNVALGGTLIQDIPTERTDTLPHKSTNGGLASHPVTTQSNSWVRRTHGPAPTTNSHHHQAIDRPGDGLRVTARAEDGIIEAVEGCNGTFLVGVQWHPERETPRPSPLFREFVRATGGTTR